MRESEIERALGVYARKLGCLYYKFTSPANRGVPDRIIISPDGKTLYLEIKAKDQRPTKLQESILRDLMLRGCRADWTNNLDFGKYLIDQLCSTSPPSPTSNLLSPG